MDEAKRPEIQDNFESDPKDFRPAWSAQNVQPAVNYAAVIRIEYNYDHYIGLTLPPRS